MITITVTVMVMITDMVHSYRRGYSYAYSRYICHNCYQCHYCSGCKVRTSLPPFPTPYPYATGPATAPAPTPTTTPTPTTIPTTLPDSLRPLLPYSLKVGARWVVRGHDDMPEVSTNSMEGSDGGRGRVWVRAYARARAWVGGLHPQHEFLSRDIPANRIGEGHSGRR